MNALTKATPLALAVALVAPAAQAAPPTPHQLTIAASSTRVVFGENVALTGTLTGADAADETITLQEDPFPFGEFKNALTTRTAADGTYRFERTPSVNVKYRANAKSKSPATSPEVAVSVAPRITFSVSDKTPDAGDRVRFAGTVAPAHDGQKVSIQRRSSSGRYRTIARATLTDAGDAVSNWKRTLTINTTGTFRVVLPLHEDHATGKSRRIRVAVE
jgi:plastocyanin